MGGDRNSGEPTVPPFSNGVDVLYATPANKLTKGQMVFVDGARGAAREAGWDINEFDYVQSYLSAFVHSYPVSFMRADEHRISFSDPSDFQINFCEFAVRVAASTTELVERRMAAFSVPGAGDPLGQVDD